VSGKELAIVRKEITGIYATWHACGLRKAERGMPKGRLCDACMEMVQAHVEDIKNRCDALHAAGELPKEGR